MITYRGYLYFDRRENDLFGDDPNGTSGFDFAVMDDIEYRWLNRRYRVQAARPGDERKRMQVAA